MGPSQNMPSLIFSALTLLWSTYITVFDAQYFQSCFTDMNHHSPNQMEDVNYSMTMST